MADRSLSLPQERRRGGGLTSFMTPSHPVINEGRENSPSGSLVARLVWFCYRHFASQNLFVQKVNIGTIFIR
jgi:hypothetical protein